MMAEAGMTIAQIQEAGDWAHPSSLNRYVRGAGGPRARVMGDTYVHAAAAAATTGSAGTATGAVTSGGAQVDGARGV